MGRFASEFWGFMKVRKKFWLLPVAVVLTLLAGLFALTSGSTTAPFIYRLF
jgi:hypothetical protein